MLPPSSRMIRAPPRAGLGDPLAAPSQFKYHRKEELAMIYVLELFS